MSSATVRVSGLRELQSAFRKIDRHLVSDFGNDLKKLAEPVARTARAKVTRYAGASVSTIRPRRSGLTVYVEQSARKVTGRRGDFGALQMRTVLEPALDEHSDQIMEGADDLLGRWAGDAGF